MEIHYDAWLDRQTRVHSSFAFWTLCLNHIEPSYTTTYISRWLDNLFPFLAGSSDTYPNNLWLSQHECSVMGYSISYAGIRVDPKKLSAIRQLSPPTDLTSLKSFLGMVRFFRSHIRSFSHISKPLYYVTAKGAPFLWTAECQQAWEFLISKLSTAPTLSIFNQLTLKPARGYVRLRNPCDFGTNKVSILEIRLRWWLLSSPNNFLQHNKTSAPKTANY